MTSRALLLQPQYPADRPAEVRARERRMHQFIREHNPFVWRLAKYWGLPAADADDVAQDVMLTVARRFDDIEPGCEQAFLYQTTRHVTRRAQRSRGRRCEDATDDLSDHAATQPGPDELLERRQAHDELCRVLDRIPEKLRTVLVLFDFQGRSQVEISQILGLAPGTVASRIRRGRDRFAHLARASSPERMPTQCESRVRFLGTCVGAPTTDADGAKDEECIDGGCS